MNAMTSREKWTAAITATPTPFGSKRAKEIWASKGQYMLDIEAVMTVGEIAYVRQVWDTLSGSSNFMTAFFKIKSGRVKLP